MNEKTFGVTLAELRRANGMTQLELADKLGVTDKAVSKWERDLALPEVENLIKISDMFGVSLDYLLRGRESITQEAVSVNAVQNPTEKFSTRKIIGTVLLCFGAVLFILLLLLTMDILGSLFFASPLLLCGVVFIVCKKRHGLMCCWVVFWCVSLYLLYVSGISISGYLVAITITVLLKIGGYDMHVIICAAELLAYLGLTVWTVISFRNEPVARKHIIWFIIAPAVMYVSLTVTSVLFSKLYDGLTLYTLGDFIRLLYSLATLLLSFLKQSCLVVLVTAAVNMLSNRLKTKN